MLALSIITPAGVHGFCDGLVCPLEIETLRIELPARPAAHRLMFFMLRGEPRLQKVGIAGVSANIFGRASPLACDAAGVFDPILDFRAV